MKLSWEDLAILRTSSILTSTSLWLTQTETMQRPSLNKQRPHTKRFTFPGYKRKIPYSQRLIVIAPKALPTLALI